MEILQETIFRLKDGVELREEDEGAVLLVDSNSGNGHALNTTGHCLIKGCQEGLPVGVSIEILKMKYPEKSPIDIEVDFSHFWAEVSDFLEADEGNGDYKSILGYICPPPRGVGFALTSGCNLRCKHCAVAAGAFGQDELSTEEWLDILSQLAELKVSHIAFTGGEPFLRNDFFEVFSKAMELSMSAQINTNGTLLNEDIVRRIVDLSRQPVFIVVGLDGASAYSHEKLRNARSFDDAIRGMRLLADNDIKFGTFTVITTYNKHELRAIVKLAKEIGAYKADLAFPVPTGRALEYEKAINVPSFDIMPILKNLEEIGNDYPNFIGGAAVQIMEQYRFFEQGVPYPPGGGGKFIGCGAAFQVCTIRPDGIVVPCDMTHNFLGGNVRERSFWEIWQSSEGFRSIRSMRGMPLAQMDGCKTCNYNFLCKGGCPAFAYSTTGIWSCRSPFCLMPIAE